MALSEANRPSHAGIRVSPNTPEALYCCEKEDMHTRTTITNWVVAQRTLIHLSQLLEIIATGGRMKPTYGKEEAEHTTGGLVNQVV